MVDNKNTEKSKCSRILVENGQGTVVCDCEKEKIVLCDVCGHANTERDALCKNCSNYLERR